MRKRLLIQALFLLLVSAQGIDPEMVLYRLTQIISTIMGIAWAVVIIAYFMGIKIWAVPGTSRRLKWAAHGIIEDAVMASFLLAIGTTIFNVVCFILGIGLPGELQKVLFPVKLQNVTST